MAISSFKEVRKAMKIYIRKREIQKKIHELSLKISSDYPDGLIAIGVLKGAWIFMADLVRRLTCPVYCDFVMLSSYKGKETTHKVNLLLPPSISIYQKDVLVIEDIVDTGITSSFLKEYLLSLKPKSLKFCCFLDKREKRRLDFTPDYVGFIIEDRFVVGYGLDLDEAYRNIPYIGIV